MQRETEFVIYKISKYLGFWLEIGWEKNFTFDYVFMFRTSNCKSCKKDLQTHKFQLALHKIFNIIII